MIFSPVQILLTILAVTLGTMLTRFLPVPAVPQQQQNAKVYSLSRKSAALCGDGHAGCLLPAQRILYHSAFRRAGSACVGLRGGLHLWKKNTLLSIGAGTTLYMVLIQFVFI